MSDDHLLIERRDNGVVVATLNRPEVLNALSPQIRSGLREMAAELRNDTDGAGPGDHRRRPGILLGRRPLQSRRARRRG